MPSYYEENKEVVNVKAGIRYQADQIKCPTKVLVRQAKHRAKVKGIAFNLTADDVIIPDVCPLLGIPIFRGNKKVGPNSPSLDRKDPKGGYVRGNVWVISHRANTLKWDSSLHECLILAANRQRHGV